MIVVILVIVCLLFAVATYFILYQLGVVPGPSGSEGRFSESPPLSFRTRTPFQEARSEREWPQGCMISVLVAAGVWFLLWGLVLVLALRVLSNPFG